MSTAFVNAAGGVVSLYQGGMQTHQLPAGFNGGLNLAGDYTATLAAVGSVASQVTTNYSGQYYDFGTVQVTVNNTTGDVLNNLLFNGVNAGTLASGYSLTGIIPHGSEVTFDDPSSQVHVAMAGSWDTANLNVVTIYQNGAWGQIGMGTTNYSTNYSTNAGGPLSLGGFSVSEFTRSVVATPATVELSTYQLHFEVAGWGFAIGCVIFFHRWVLNVLSAMGREEDL